MACKAQPAQKDLVTWQGGHFSSQRSCCSQETAILASSQLHQAKRPRAGRRRVLNVLGQGSLGLLLVTQVCAASRRHRWGGTRRRRLLLLGRAAGDLEKLGSLGSAFSADFSTVSQPAGRSEEPQKGEELVDSKLRQLFQRFDKNRNGSVSQSEFLEICMKELGLALSKVEVRRLFANLDTNLSGEISFTKFRHGIRRNSLLRAVAMNFNAHVDQVVPESYDYSTPTYVAHRHPDFLATTPEGTSKERRHNPQLHGAVQGDFAEIRRKLDYSWHTNYTLERQKWQDQVVRRVAQCTKPQNRPWVVFTCGAMGAGKGYAMSWLSKHGIFPLEHIVHIDPDHFKSLMPEWRGYIAKDKEEAGTMCHKESGYLQEIAQEVAMQGSQNVWIDGSLGDHRWYSTVIGQIRRRFPKYRIALIAVVCDSGQLEARVQKRARETGRYVPKRKLEESISKTAEAVEHLNPLTDFYAKIDNNETIPWLELCVDRSHSFVSLRRQFLLGKVAQPFPSELGDICLQRQELLSAHLELPSEVREALTRPDPGGGRSPSPRMHRVPLLVAFPREPLHSKLKRTLVGRVDILGPVFLLITPAAEICLDKHSRSRAAIPEEARFWALCHGCVDEQGQRVDIMAAFSPGASALLCLSETGEVLGVNVTSSESVQDTQFFIRCSEPREMPSAVDWKLELAERWVRPLSPPKVLGVAEAVAWLLPGELPECPFGGFAYRFYEGPELVYPLNSSE